MSSTQVKWDQSVFNRTLDEYRKVSKRTLQQIINTKAFYVARKAIWFTRKADSNRIKGQLGQFVSVRYTNKKGKTATRRKLALVQGRTVNAPLAALIVNKRRGAAGLPGLYGSKMTKAVREMLGARLRSVAFLTAGWLPAVRKLAPFATDKSKAPNDPAAKQIGRPKGDARAAPEGFNPIAEIVNNATTRNDEKGALRLYGGPGLQRAFSDEAASMRQYIEDKMRKDAERFNKQQG